MTTGENPPSERDPFAVPLSDIAACFNKFSEGLTLREGMHQGRLDESPAYRDSAEALEEAHKIAAQRELLIEIRDELTSYTIQRRMGGAVLRLLDNSEE